jgi:hypothetical protein
MVAVAQRLKQKLNQVAVSAMEVMNLLAVL